MPRIKLTAAAVDRIKPTDKQADYFDATLPGFGLRLTPKGAKSWIVFYRNAAGKQRRYTIGRYPAFGLKDAREEAGNVLRRVDKGEDPAQEKQAAKAKARDDTPNPRVFENAVQKFIREHHKGRNRTWRAIEQLFANHVTPRWKGRDVADITRRDVKDLLRELVESGYTTQANRVLAHVRKLFNWALDEYELDASPVAGIQKPHKENTRERRLDEQEVRDLWRAFDAAGYPFGALFKFMTLTGQRRGECAGLRRKHIDFDKALWTIPGELTKNGKPQDVPLSDQALALIESLPRFGSGDFVFTSNYGARPVSGFGKAKERVERVVNETRTAEGREPMENWRLHDIRRTVASGLGDIGIPGEVIARVLNHSPTSFQGITATYDRAKYVKQKRHALQAWADALDRVLAGERLDAIEAENVVQLAEAR